MCHSSSFRCAYYLYLLAAGEFHFKYWIIEMAHNGKIIATSHFLQYL